MLHHLGIRISDAIVNCLSVGASVYINLDFLYTVEHPFYVFYGSNKNDVKFRKSLCIIYIMGSRFHWALQTPRAALVIQTCRIQEYLGMQQILESFCKSTERLFAGF